MSRVALESPWQPINVGMKCASHWVAHYKTPRLLEKVGKTMNKNFVFDGDLHEEFLILTLL